MFLTLPTTPGPCSRSSSSQQAQQQPPLSTHQSRPKLHRHTSLLTLLNPKKQSRKSKPHTHPIDTTVPLLPTLSSPPSYDFLYPNISAPHTSVSETPIYSPTTRSSSRKQTHIRKPSQPWTTAPNAPKRAALSTEREFDDSFDAYYPSSSYYPSHDLTGTCDYGVGVSGVSPVAERPVYTYATYYPSRSSEMDDLYYFSLFSCASGGGEGEGEVKRCAWERVGARRAREGVGHW